MTFTRGLESKTHHLCNATPINLNVSTEIVLSFSLMALQLECLIF